MLTSKSWWTFTAYVKPFNFFYCGSHLFHKTFYKLQYLPEVGLHHYWIRPSVASRSTSIPTSVCIFVPKIAKRAHKCSPKELTNVHKTVASATENHRENPPKN